MATCPKCGAVNHEGKFCSQCGAPLGAPSPSGQIVPPTFGGQPPAYGAPPPPLMGQPPTYGGQFPPQQPWAPPPPRRSGSKVGLVIGGVLLVVVLGFVALIALLPDEEPVQNPTPPPNQSAQTEKPVEPTPPAANPPAQQAPAPAPAPAPQAKNSLGVRQIAQGQVDRAFHAFDWHSRGILSLATGDGTHVTLTMYDYVNGKLQPAIEVHEPMGELRDVAYGRIFNDQKDRAILTTEKGLLLVDADGEVERVAATNIQRIYVGDWDGDGQQEAAIFMTVDGKPMGLVNRYFLDKETEKVGLWEVNEFPEWPAQTFLSVNKRRVLLGVNAINSNAKEVVLYTIDPTKGLERSRAQQVESLWTNPLIGAAAGILGGQPTVVLTYQGSPSHIELLDITESGYTSRGKMQLPDDGEYYPILGAFSGNELEMLAITPEGKWILYGF